MQVFKNFRNVVYNIRCIVTCIFWFWYLIQTFFFYFTSVGKYNLWLLKATNKLPSQDGVGRSVHLLSEEGNKSRPCHNRQFPQMAFVRQHGKCSTGEGRVCVLYTITLCGPFWCFRLRGFGLQSPTRRTLLLSQENNVRLNMASNKAPVLSPVLYFYSSTHLINVSAMHDIIYLQATARGTISICLYVASSTRENFPCQQTRRKFYF